MLMGLLFIIVLLHEFGHCFGARLMDGDAENILIWPLGGLAAVEVPQTPRANFITTAAGPLANLLICLVAGLGFCVLTDFKLRPPWNPLPMSDWGWSPYRVDDAGHLLLYNWSGHAVEEGRLAVIVLARMFWLSLVLFVLNVLHHRPSPGRRPDVPVPPVAPAGAPAVDAVGDFRGFIMAIIIGIASLVVNEIMIFCLAGFIFVCCWQQLALLESGDDSVFGYDFSQGYTSLEREPAAAARPRRPAEPAPALEAEPPGSQGAARTGKASRRRAPHGRAARRRCSAGLASAHRRRTPFPQTRQ